MYLANVCYHHISCSTPLRKTKDKVSDEEATRVHAIAPSSGVEDTASMGIKAKQYSRYGARLTHRYRLVKHDAADSAGG
ncbi:hypothetical protein Rcae01_04084 [Novipirellula caenicola]|uniref:Uncharacterized protein n=1 Tax=Novipirellula caenicola TaxID=1536901 RepID=A0ABP9VTZ9_9BACT